MRINFTKMHGAGNDFIVFDAPGDAQVPDADQLRADGTLLDALAADVVDPHDVTVLAALPEALASARVPILGCDLEGDPVHGVAGLESAVVVIGSEGRGLSAEVKALLTRRVTIARRGAAESLNAAVAAGIVCDNLRRPAG